MENNIETGVTEIEVTETKKPHVVTLDNPSCAVSKNRRGDGFKT